METKSLPFICWPTFSPWVYLVSLFLAGTGEQQRGCFQGVYSPGRGPAPQGVVDGVSTLHAGAVRLIQHGLHFAPSSHEALLSMC